MRHISNYCPLMDATIPLQCQARHLLAPTAPRAQDHLCQQVLKSEIQCETHACTGTLHFAGTRRCQSFLPAPCKISSSTHCAPSICMVEATARFVTSCCLTLPFRYSILGDCCTRQDVGFTHAHMRLTDSLPQRDRKSEEGGVSARVERGAQGRAWNMMMQRGVGAVHCLLSPPVSKWEGCVVQPPLSCRMPALAWLGEDVEHARRRPGAIAGQHRGDL